MGPVVRGRRSSGDEELNQHPEWLIPVLVHYGFEEPTENLGSRAIKCGFHGDSTPSATVNTAEGWFNCHTYAECPSGNAVQIIMKKEQVDYREAYEIAESIGRASGAEVSSTRQSRRSGGSRGRSSGGARLRRSWRS